MKTATTQTNIASALAAATAPTGKVHPLLADLPPAIPGLTARAVHVLEQIEQAKKDNPEISDFLGLVAEEIRKAGDSPAVIDNVLALISPKTACTEYGWCVETGEHFEHFSKYTAAPNPDAYGRDVICVGLIDFGEGVRVGLLDLDLTPAEARVRLAELRAHLDAVEALVAVAETDR
ncbi:hypothetical protein [Streptomyces sp. R33]|uniref:Uncharacterized protein n=1 Tax=Streptomyces sp. R33 TaxID=3238629 RepID=A0AB39Y448_9ACTN